MRFVIVTGISGAGKSTALKFLEDAQYFLRGQSSNSSAREVCVYDIKYEFRRDPKRSFGSGCEKWPAAWRFGRDFKKDEKAGLPI